MSSALLELVERIEGLTPMERVTINGSIPRFESIVALIKDNQDMLKEFATLYAKAGPLIQTITAELPYVLPAIDIILSKLKDQQSVST